MGCEELRDDRLAVLYGEADEDAVRRVHDHQASCVACREEFAGLEHVRRLLATWALPESLAPGTTVGRFRSVPRLWLGLAAAAGLLLVAGGALRLAGASFEYRAGPVALRLGAARPSVELQAQEERHRRELAELRAELRGVQDRLKEVPGDEVRMRRVEQLIRESEERQDRNVAARLTGVEQRTDAQRRYDLARISAGLSYLDGKTGQHVAQTTELLGYMLQASQPR